MRGVIKGLQRRTLTCINTWQGFVGLVILIIGAVIISSIEFIRLVGTNESSYNDHSHFEVDQKSSRLYDFADNIGNINMESMLAFGPMDVVYTWVNGSDPVWLRKKDLYTKLHFPTNEHAMVDSNMTGVNNTINMTNGTVNTTSLINVTTGGTNNPEDDTNSNNRYRDSNELKYSLRSIEKNAPWIRKIYLVTDNQIPNWLNLENDRISIISHNDIFLNKSHLPVFSSPAIESHLHRIPGLSKKFIYFNDDVFLGTKVSPEDFVTISGAQKFYLSWDVPKCAVGCADSWIGDGYCDTACNVSSCNFDYPDCVNGTNTNRGSSGGNSGARPNAQCVTGCPDNWLADKVCDMRCKHEDCGWDVGDCGIDRVVNSFPGVKLQSSMVKISKKISTNESDVDVSLSEMAAIHQNHSIAQNYSDYEHLIPVGMTIPKGIKTVYFNVSFLQCESLTSGSSIDCTADMHVPGFAFQFAEVIDGPIVHVSVLLTKFQLLVLVLYNGQEHAPDYPNLPFDTAIRVGGYNSVTNVYVNATFLLRVEEVARDNSVVDAGFPLDMGFVKGYAGTCSPVKPFNKKPVSQRLRSGASNAMLSLVEVNDVALLSKPFAASFVTPQDIANEVNNSPEVSPLTQGIVLELTWPSIDSLSPDFLRLPANNVNVAITMTVLNESTTYWSKAALPSLIGMVNESNLVISRMFPVPTEDATVLDILLYVSRSPSYTSVVSKLDPLESAKKSFSSQARLIVPESQVPISMLFLVPVPIAWNSVDSSSWVHFQATASYNHSQRTTRAAPALLWHTIDNSNHSAQAYENETSRHQPKYAITLAHIHRHPDLTRYLCLAGSFQWGDSRPRDSAKMNETSAADAATSMTDSTARRLYASESARPVDVSRTNQESLDWAVMELKLFGSDRRTSEPDIIVGTKVNAEAFDFGARRKLTTLTELVSPPRQKFQLKLIPRPSKLTKHIEPGPHQLGNQRSSDWVSLVSSLNLFFGTSRDAVSPYFEQKNRHQRRRLEDTYAQSLINVNRMYNKAFGTETTSRKVPAHMPHMIDKDVVEEMQQRWKAEWEETSTHRFRSSKDMQYSFSYYYYVMNRNKAITRNIFEFVRDEVDSNQDGFIDRNEFRTLVKLTTPQKGLQGTEFENALVQCIEDSAMQILRSNRTYESTNSSSSGIKPAKLDIDQLNSTDLQSLGAASQHESLQFFVPEGEIESVSKSFAIKKRPSVKAVAACGLVIEGIKANVDWSLYSPTHSVGSENNVAFEMIGDNYTNTLQQLDSIRGRRAKFICVNDNMQNPSKELEEALRTFFESFFPIPSQFELPTGTQNPTLYWDEYQDLRKTGRIPHGKIHRKGNDQEKTPLTEPNLLVRFSRQAASIFDTFVKSVLTPMLLTLLDSTAQLLRAGADFLQPSTPENSSGDVHRVELLANLRKDISIKPILDTSAARDSISVIAESKILTSQSAVDSRSGSASYKLTPSGPTTNISVVRSALSLLILVTILGICCSSCVRFWTRMGPYQRRPHLDIEGRPHARRSFSGSDDFDTKPQSPVKKTSSWGWVKHTADGHVVNSDEEDASSDSSSDVNNVDRVKVVRVARGDTLKAKTDSTGQSQSVTDDENIDSRGVSMLNSGGSRGGSGRIAEGLLANIITTIQSVPSTVVSAATSAASSILANTEDELDSDGRRYRRRQKTRYDRDAEDIDDQDDTEDDDNDALVAKLDRRDFFIFNYSDSVDFKDMWVGRGSFKSHRKSGTPKKSVRWHSTTIGFGDGALPLRHRVGQGLRDMISRATGNSQGSYSYAKEKHTKAL